MQSASAKRVRRSLRIAREFAFHATRLRQPPDSRFLILSQARSGSSALASLLNCVPNVHCDGEILLRPLPFPERYIHARSAAKPCSTYGFKLLVWHVLETQRFQNPDELLRRLYAEGFSVIRLKRHDRLAAAVSILRAHRFGFHERKAQSGTLPREPIAIEYAQLIQRFEYIEFHEQYADKLVTSVPHLMVNYETDLADQEKHQCTVDRLCDSLGIASGPVESGFQKLSTRPLRETVLNFDELDERIRETKWSGLFDRHR